ncbi:hypothetical protein IMZ48_16150 [Candidatus Bathyarchaeota archaeon]|nr:hypothetical protein [Candidatus Bathyarchaeota archaeon]
MARYISSSASRLPRTWSCRAYATSSPATQAGLTDLESTSMGSSSTKPDEAMLKSFNDRKTALKAQHLPGNR